MRYGSVCSGIEAATVAWHPLGWKPAFFSEIEPFPSAVLAHHYPEVRNYGDFTKLIDATHPVHREQPIDLLVGGTPCQAFSVAGLRQGLADPRGGLTLEFLRLAQSLRPKWIVWENVPGVLSQDGGRAFGAFLGGLEDLGYGWAYRVLDAQYTRVDGYPGAVPQRRKRVFVVGCAGADFARAAAVLLEPEGVRRDSPPRRASRKGVAADATPSVAGAIDTECGGGKLTHQSAANGHLLGCYWDGGQVTQTLDKTGPLDTDGHTIGVCVTGDRTHALTTRSDAHHGGGLNGQDAYTGRIQPVAFDTTQITSTTNRSNPKAGDPCHPLAAGAHPPAIAFTGRIQPVSVNHWDGDYAHPTLNQAHNTGGIGQSNQELFSQRGGGLVGAMFVRRLTPVECERLQGFPDDYTRIPWRKKLAEECPDGGRYKALGNSMAVNCMRWIGRRIELVEGS